MAPGLVPLLSAQTGHEKEGAQGTEAREAAAGERAGAETRAEGRALEQRLREPNKDTVETSCSVRTRAFTEQRQQALGLQGVRRNTKKSMLFPHTGTYEGSTYIRIRDGHN